MDEYAVDILPGEVLAWVREDAGRKEPRLWVRASKEYEMDNDYVRQSDRIGEEEVETIIVRGLMEISPRQGRGWTLQLAAEDSVGLRAAGEDGGYENDDDMSVDAFESDFLFPEHGDVEITVLAEDTAAWGNFQRWLARRRART